MDHASRYALLVDYVSQGSLDLVHCPGQIVDVVGGNIDLQVRNVEIKKGLAGDLQVGAEYRLAM